MLKKGYSLMEAMIAIAVLSSVTVVALNTITNSADTEVLNKDYITALMLIDSTEQEILSLYKNNLVKFGKENESKCGLNINLEITKVSDCNNTFSIINGKYIIYATPQTNSINVELVSGEFVENQIDDVFQIYEVPIGESDNFLFSQSPILKESSTAKATKFYKMISAETLESENEIEIKVGFQKRNGEFTIQSKNLNLNLSD